MRANPNFLRTGFQCMGELEIPMIRKVSLPDDKIDLIACSRTKINDLEENRRKGVHFFVDDYRFDVLRRKPNAGLMKYSQYAFVLSPDFSRYNEMPVWKVIEAVGMNRWIGAYWQKAGLKVIPSVGWATAITDKFCFLGVERNSLIAITTNGNRRERRPYLRGYDAMLERIEPSAIICFGKPFPEMRGNIIPVKLRYSWKREMIMGGNGTFAVGRNASYQWKTVKKVGGVKVLEPILSEGHRQTGHKLPEEAHSSRMYILQYGDGNFSQLRIYDSFHRVRFEFGYHREASIDKSAKAVLHYHTYTYYSGSSLFTRSKAKKVTLKMWQRFKQYFTGVEYNEKQ